MTSPAHLAPRGAAVLVLEDGRAFHGEALRRVGQTVGEARVRHRR